jgi:hypothetical protein
VPVMEFYCKRKGVVVGGYWGGGGEEVGDVDGVVNVCKFYT